MTPGGHSQSMTPGGHSQSMSPGDHSQSMTPGGHNQSMSHGNHNYDVTAEGSNAPKGRVGLTKDQQKEYVKFRSSGWLRNWDGSWEKDPNVEFDSDEESPQLWGWSVAP